MQQEIMSALIQAQAAFHQFDQDGEFKGHSKTLAQKKVSEAIEALRDDKAIRVEANPFLVIANGEEAILNIFRFLGCQAAAIEYFSYTEEYMTKVFNTALDNKYELLSTSGMVPLYAGASTDPLSMVNYNIYSPREMKIALKKLSKQKRIEQSKFALQFEQYKTRVDGLMSHMMTMGKKFETADSKMVDGIMAFMEKGIIDKDGH